MLFELPDVLRHRSKADRPAAFADRAESLPRSKAAGAAFWQAVVREWSGFDRIVHPRFARLFGRFRFIRPTGVIEHLPDQIHIYRGQNTGDAFGLA